MDERVRRLFIIVYAEWNMESGDDRRGTVTIVEDGYWVSDDVSTSEAYRK